jgi:hypothetical protein
MESGQYHSQDKLTKIQQKFILHFSKLYFIF